MTKKPVVVNRGVDTILIIDEKIIEIGNLSGTRLIDLLNRHNLTDIKLVSFDEYEKSDVYPKAVI